MGSLLFIVHSICKCSTHRQCGLPVQSEALQSFLLPSDLPPGSVRNFIQVPEPLLMTDQIRTLLRVKGGGTHATPDATVGRGTGLSRGTALSQNNQDGTSPFVKLSKPQKCRIWGGGGGGRSLVQMYKKLTKKKNREKHRFKC